VRGTSLAECTDPRIALHSLQTNSSDDRQFHCLCCPTAGPASIAPRTSLCFPFNSPNAASDFRDIV